MADQARHALIVAFHFPPAAGSSGIQRAFSIARYLPDYHWIPVVLSAAERAHETTSKALLTKLPQHTEVHRTFALDVARHLSIRGRYPDLLAYPDRWNTWWFSAVIKGLRLIRKHRPKVIFSTYPLATAHLIALTLHRLTKVPWIADFRDSMTEEGYPADPRKRRVFQWIESRTVEHASAVIFTAPGAKKMYEDRYPDVDPRKFRLVRNGYDEDIFQDAERLLTDNEQVFSSGKFILLHSGVIYPKERDPRHFFQALGELRDEGVITAKTLEVRLRATGHDALIKTLVTQYGLQEIVSIAAAVTYAEAIQEMLTVDGLILMQAASCNHQIPAKAYEYIRARKQILALTDYEGDTAALLSEIPNAWISELDCVKSIKVAVTRMLDSRMETGATSDGELVASYSRKHQISHFSQIFSEFTN